MSIPFVLMENQIEPQDGELLGTKYLVERDLGEGGMGVVKLVRRQGTAHRFAAKMVPRARIGMEADQSNLMRELEILVDLPEHPHLARYCFFENIDGQLVIFTEFIEGGSLEEWIRQNKLTKLEDILDVSIQVAWGLEAVHRLGLAHRDIKPTNVLMTNERQALVADFGISRHQASQSDSRTSSGLASRGTLQFRSLEQASGESVTYKTDIWSWGLLVITMLQGEVTWLAGEAAPDVLESLVEEGLSAVAEKPIPKPIIEILEKCFRDPESRWSTMGEAADAMVRAFREIVGSGYYRSIPPFPAMKRSVGRHDRSTTSGLTWESPEVWLYRARRAVGLPSGGQQESPQDRLAQRSPISHSLQATYDRMVAERGRSPQANLIADLDSYQKAKRIYEQLVSSGRSDVELDLARLCEDLAILSGRCHDVTGAKTARDRAISILEKLLGNTEFGHVGEDLARLYLSRGNHESDYGRKEEALKYYDRVIEICERRFRGQSRTGGVDILGMAYMNKANATAMLGNHCRARDLYDRAIEIYTDLRNRQGWSDIPLQLARAYFNKANAVAALGNKAAAAAFYDDSISIFKETVAVSNSQSSQLATHEAAIALAHKANVVADPLEAIELSRKASETLRGCLEADDCLDLAHDLIVARVAEATAIIAAGRVGQAVTAYDEVIAYLERLVERRGGWELEGSLALAYSNAAQTYVVAGNQEHAARLARQSVEIYERLVSGEQHVDLAADFAGACLTAGNVILNLGKLAEAVAFYDRAQRLLEELVREQGFLGSAPRLAEVYKSKAVALRSSGDCRSALKFYNHAIDILKPLATAYGQHNDLMSLSTAYQNKANAHLELHEVHEALSYYGKAIEIREGLVFHEGHWEMAHRLAVVYMNKCGALSALGDHGGVLFFVGKAIELFDRLIAEGRHELECDRAKARASRATCLAVTGDYREAELEANRAFPVLEAELHRNRRTDLERFIAFTKEKFEKAMTARTNQFSRNVSQVVKRFKCTDPNCTFDAIIPNAPTGADACRCQICGDMAVLFDPENPVFKCQRCNYVFRAYGSTHATEDCRKCGRKARRLF